MGNKGSYEGPFVHVEMTPQKTPLVVLDKRFVRSQVTRLRIPETSSDSKNVAFKNIDSSKTEFRAGPDLELQTFLDSAKTPIAKVLTKEGIGNMYYVYRPESAPANSAEAASDKYKSTELFQVYVRQGLITTTGYLDLDLRVDFTDITTGEHCRVVAEGEWRARSAMLWLQRSNSTTRTPLGKIYRPTYGLRNGFNMEVAPNVDIAFVMLVCAVIDDDLKRERTRENKLGFWA